MSVRDELHRLIDELPDHDIRAVERLLRARTLPKHISLDALAAQQGFRPITDPFTLAEGIWPEDESVDDFLTAREAWRHEDINA